MDLCPSKSCSLQQFSAGAGEPGTEELVGMLNLETGCFTFPIAFLL